MPNSIPQVNDLLRSDIWPEPVRVLTVRPVGDRWRIETVGTQTNQFYKNFRIPTGLAMAIFFGSFSGAERKGMGIQRLRLAVLREDIPAGPGRRHAATAGDGAVAPAGRGRPVPLFQSAQPEPHHRGARGAVKEEQVLEELRRRLASVAGLELPVVLWPRDSQDVVDTKALKLVVLSPDYPHPSDDATRFVEKLLDKCGQNFRIYRKTLLVLAMDKNELTRPKQQAKRYLALRSIQDDEALMEQLPKENRRMLESHLKDSESKMDFNLLSAYRHLAKAGREGTVWINLGLPTIGERLDSVRRVRRYLEREDALATRLAPKQLLEKALGQDEQEKAVESG